MEPGLIWILGGLLLLLAELALPGVFLLWVGFAAIGAGLVTLAIAPGLETAAAVFLGLLGLGIWLALRLQRRPAAVGSASINQPGSGLIGRSGTLLPLEAGGLRVRIGDSDWPARLPRDLRVPDAEIRVKVEGLDGTTLLVRPEIP